MNLREQVSNALALLKQMGRQSEEIAVTQRAIRDNFPLPPPVKNKRVVLTVIRGGLK